MSEEIKEYIKIMAERVEIYEKAKKDISVVYKKINNFAQSFISENPTLQVKDLTEAFITYKTIKYQIEPTQELPQELKDWLSEHQAIIEAIHKYEKDAESPFDYGDLRTYYTVGSPVPEALDKDYIFSVFRPDLFSSAKGELKEVQEVVDSILLKRKIDSLSDKQLRSLYYDITNISENKHLQELYQEMKTVKQRYLRNALLENNDYLTDPYYISLKEQIIIETKRREEQKEYIGKFPIDVIRDNMYRLLSEGKDDYDKVREGNEARQTLIKSGFDISTLKEKIEETAHKLYVLGIETEENTGVVDYTLEAIKNVYEIEKRTIESYEDYEQILKDTKIYGLGDSIPLYLEYLSGLKTIKAKKDAIEDGIVESKRAKQQYDSLFLIKKLLSKKARKLNGLADNIVDLEAENEKLEILKNDRTEVLTQQLAVVQNDLLKFEEAYNIRMKSKSLLNPIVCLIKDSLMIKDDDFRSSYMVNMILSGHGEARKRESDNIEELAKILDNGSRSIIGTVAREKEDLEKSIGETQEFFNELIILFPNLVEKGVTIETITPSDIKEEQQNQMAYYELLCSATAAEDNKLVDRAFEIMAASRQNNQNMKNDVFQDKVKQYVKRVNSCQSNKEN